MAVLKETEGVNILMSQSEISKRIRGIVQEQMVKHEVSYEDVKATFDEGRQDNPLTNAKNMLRKSMVENNRTVEAVRRDLKLGLTEFERSIILPEQKNEMLHAKDMFDAQYGVISNE